MKLPSGKAQCAVELSWAGELKTFPPGNFEGVSFGTMPREAVTTSCFRITLRSFELPILTLPPILMLSSARLLHPFIAVGAASEGVFRSYVVRLGGLLSTRSRVGWHTELDRRNAEG